MQNRMVKIQNLIDKRQHIRNVENYIFNDDESWVLKSVSYLNFYINTEKQISFLTFISD